ncbi:MAG: hypothetical protein K2M77_07965 [Muribaculaceae bacterium]|nr:hypothetical protein [Muribaculaceae bacterium]
MRWKCMAAAALSAAATLSCGHRTLTTGTNNKDVQTFESARLWINDSMTTSRNIGASLRNPRIIVMHRGVEGDSSIVIIAAEEITVGDSVKTATVRLTEITDSSVSQATEVTDLRVTPVTSSSAAWRWIAAAVAVMTVVIVLSLRGTGFRR